MAPVLMGLLCVAGVLLAILTFAVFIFQVACRWCGVRRPSYLAAAGIVSVSYVVTLIMDTVFHAILREIYKAAGYPLWEVTVVAIFLWEPLHMFIATGLHVGLMRERFGKAIEIWFVRELILLSLLLAVTGVVVVGILAAKN